MRHFIFNIIWQWRFEEWIEVDLAKISGTYDAVIPEVAFTFIVLGFGFQIIVGCPWETESSKYCKELTNELIRMMEIDKPNVSND